MQLDFVAEFFEGFGDGLVIWAIFFGEGVEFFERPTSGEIVKICVSVIKDGIFVLKGYVAYGWDGVKNCEKIFDSGGLMGEKEMVFVV